MPIPDAPPRALARLRRVRYWLNDRNPAYMLRRSGSLLKRYGINAELAKRRVLEGVQFLASRGCRPTLPTPGRVVSRYAGFCAELQAGGAELAVHGHDHVDFRSLAREQVTQQLLKAVAAFERSGIQADGFRCPYLSFTREMLDAVPPQRFSYSSNEAIWWDVLSEEQAARANAVFRSLRQFYKPQSSGSTAAVPRMQGGLVEIPASLPDDLQLYDGLRLGGEGLARAWCAILRNSHRRGEVFVLLFHPESFVECRPAFEALFAESTSLRPQVWIAPLRDIAKWWREKSAFTVRVSPNGSGANLDFLCSERATVLMRNLGNSNGSSWDGTYKVLDGRRLWISNQTLPFIGIAPNVPADTASFLAEQGYIVVGGDSARRCSIYLDASTVAQLRTQVGLIEFVESSPASLVRYWRWPHAAKSALCVSGDLDALSLLDYFSRVFTI